MWEAFLHTSGPPSFYYQPLSSLIQAHRKAHRKALWKAHRKRTVNDGSTNPRSHYLMAYMQPMYKDAVLAAVCGRRHWHIAQLGTPWFRYQPSLSLLDGHCCFGAQGCVMDIAWTPDGYTLLACCTGGSVIRVTFNVKEIGGLRQLWPAGEVFHVV